MKSSKRQWHRGRALGLIPLMLLTISCQSAPGPLASPDEPHAVLVAAAPLANFIQRNPTIVMRALAFLLLIGTTLVAEGFGAHVPKGYIYAAMAFSALVEGLNMLSRRARQKRSRKAGAG